MEWTSQQAAQMIYQMRKTDVYGELTETATLDCLVFDELENGAELIDDDVVFDALTVENKRLERTAQLLGNAFNRASGSLKVVENGIQISKPMKKNGTTNIVAMFEMTDGQVVSVFFHNPDTTPTKITPDDVLISWKWLLNRKDITIVVAKENGKDLPLPTVARRVMALVEKNTARFAKANANKAAETELLAQLQAEKTQKIARLEELNALAQQRENQETLPENDAPIEISGSEFGEFDLNTESGKQALREKAFEYLKSIINDSIYCPALKAEVGFNSSGAKKFKSLGGNPIKSKLAVAIKNIIARAILVKADVPSYDAEEKKQNITYSILKTKAVVDGIEYGVRTVIRHLPNGQYQYDLQVKDNFNAIMDSANENEMKLGRLTKSDTLHLDSNKG